MDGSCLDAPRPGCGYRLRCDAQQSACRARETGSRCTQALLVREATHMRASPYARSVGTIEHLWALDWRGLHVFAAPAIPPACQIRHGRQAWFDQVDRL